MRGLDGCGPLAVLVLLMGGTCGMPEVPPPTSLPPTPEQEPNDTLGTPQILDLSQDVLRVTGSIAGEDLDLFNLGALTRGDQITVTIDGAGTDAEISAVIYELQSDGALATLFHAVSGVGMGNGGIALDGIIRKSGQYHLGIDQRFATIEPGIQYDLTIALERGQTVPAEQPQNILLQFGGGSFTAPNGAAVTIGAFNTDSIDPSYAGMTQRVKDVLFSGMVQDFRGYGVRVFSSDGPPPPAGEPVSTVFFGPVVAGADSLASDGLGVSVTGVDRFNQNRSDVAVVLTQSFTPTLFGLDAVAAESLAVALANVGSHEAGHLLGLEHSFDPTDVMNTFDAPSGLLRDQRFKRSPIHFFLFDPLDTLLTQNGPGRLDETVGAARRSADLTLAAGGTPFSLDAADLDFNGFLDLVVANQGSSDFYVYLNNGNRTFFDPIAFDVGARPIAIRAFDINVDGLPDVLTANPGAGNVSVFLHNGFDLNLPFNVTAGEGARDVAIANFNGDIFPDLAVPNFLADNVSILLNSGFNGFDFGPTIPSGDTPQGIDTADFDGDGRTDLVLSDFGSDTVRVLKGDGSGNFTLLTTLTVANLPFGVAAADFNGDGIPDIAAASTIHVLALVQFGASISVFLGQGGGQFAPQAIYSVEPGAETVTAADLDLDGDIDLAVATTGDVIVSDDVGSVSLLFNRGDGTFDQDIVLQAGTTPTEILVRDLDNNGKPDLAVVNRDSETVSIFFSE